MRYLVLPLVLGALVPGHALAQIATQESSVNGVTIAVTPASFAPDAKVWKFTVALNTHSQELSDDLAKSTVLVDSRGAESRALGWEGAPPGGHHRSGVLKFNPVSPPLKVVEMRIRRAGESTPRTFRWNIN